MGLDTVELVLDIEREFDIEIPNEVAETFTSVGDVLAFVVAEYQRLGRPADADDIFARIRACTINITNVDPAKITLEARFVDDLGMD